MFHNHQSFFQVAPVYRDLKFSEAKNTNFLELVTSGNSRSIVSMISAKSKQFFGSLSYSFRTNFHFNFHSSCINESKVCDGQ